MNNWYYRGHHGFIISEFAKMKMMIERVLAIVDDEAASADMRFRTQCEAVPDEDDPTLDTARAELWISQTILPRHVMNSLFTSLFALFEDEMVTVCELVGKKSEGAMTFINFKNGIGLSKVKNYLKKRFQVGIDAYSSWQEIADIKDLRNMIMHNNGRFDNREPHVATMLAKYIEASEWLSIDDSQHIVIDRQYLIHVDNVLRAFLKDLFPDLKGRQLI